MSSMLFRVEKQVKKKKKYLLKAKENVEGRAIHFKLFFFFLAAAEEQNFL